LAQFAKLLSLKAYFSKILRSSCTARSNRFNEEIGDILANQGFYQDGGREEGEIFWAQMIVNPLLLPSYSVVCS
jgi:hypothetical protein